MLLTENELISSPAEADLWTIKTLELVLMGFLFNIKHWRQSFQQIFPF